MDYADYTKGIQSGNSFHYEVYGICVRSEFPLPLSERSCSDLIEVEIQKGTAIFFSKLVEETPLQPSPFRTYLHGSLPDGSSYVRWEGMGEFVVSKNGRQITCRHFDEAPLESFQAYLLGQAISFALVKNGIEPLHATCVVIDGMAVAFLGDSGYGKSSLAACCLQAGHRLLTDDQLVLREICGGFKAYPGPPRIKLFPKMANRFLGESMRGIPMNSQTTKLIMPLHAARVCTQVTPLAAIYAIAAPRDDQKNRGVKIEVISSREAFVLLMNNAFNYVIADPGRLQRQFHLTARLADMASIKRLRYPRVASILPSVREAIVADIRRKEIK